jgi:hypothetical protein
MARNTYNARRLHTRPLFTHSLGPRWMKLHSYLRAENQTRISIYKQEI